MKYANREMKIDQIIGYFNQKKINLIPPFQRGTVWPIGTRRKLIENMVQARPIPAIFLYKQSSGSQFVYNILDGKQRLESLILFVGNKRSDMQVDRVEEYFFMKSARNHINFDINMDGESIDFEHLDDALVRPFREYAIPTIEIDLDDEDASFDEVVNLFVDINQQGVKVSRFDVVKALGKDLLFKQVFQFIARQEERKKVMYYKAMNNDFVFVMKRLNIIRRVTEPNSQVDRIWERLTEIALFSRTKSHRAPADILKAFISQQKENARLSVIEVAALRNVFAFLATAYKSRSTLINSKLATDQPQFYTLVTCLLSTDLLQDFEERDLIARIDKVARMLDGVDKVPATLKVAFDEYRVAAQKQTTNPNRRAKRHDVLLNAILKVVP